MAKGPKGLTSAETRVSVISDIVNELIKGHNEGKTTDLALIKKHVARKYRVSDTPKLVEIIAAIPDEYKSSLVPLLRAKPVRTASGIAVVAVMCKPHRCPHIAMTGNICVYCLSTDMQVLTSNGFMFRDELFSALDRNEAPLVAGYNPDTEALLYETPTGRIDNPPNPQGEIIDFTVSNEVSHWNSHNISTPTAETDSHNQRNGISLRVTPEHDMYVQRGQLEHVHPKNTKEVSQNDAKICWEKSSFTKVSAQHLVTDDNRACVKLLTHAASGRVTSEDDYPFVAALGLSPQHISTFLEVYGFWLRNGYLTRSNSTGDNDAIAFHQKKSADLSYLRERFNALEVSWDEECDTCTDRVTFKIYERRWIEYFINEYGASDSIKSERSSSLYEEGVVSTKWFYHWVWNLSLKDWRSLLSGLQLDEGNETSDEHVIYTSSVQFRDDLVRACLHAGYSPHFTLKHRSAMNQSMDGAEQDAVRSQDLWKISYSDSAQYTEPHLRCAQDISRQSYSDRTWCLTMPHGYLVVRRAATDTDGSVLKASRPTIVGNCPGGPDSDFEYSTQSYTGYEPTSMRAIRARYNPYLQTRNRLDQLKRLGHSIDKVEFIIMGGTFMSLPSEYRDYFIRNLHDALSGHTSNNVEEAVRYSEQSKTKCIGITIETRPDYCLKPHLSKMLSYGCTRLEIGVQSVYEDIARDSNRGHTVAAVQKCFHLSKDAGFKVVAHMMPDLPNMGLERDIEGFKEFFENPAFRSDGLKIYPTLVIRGTGLYELWKTGQYKNYSPDTLVDLVAKILSLIPPWTRVYRIQRDIPMPLVSSGVDHGNLRELALWRMRDLGLKCRDVRTREVGIKDIHHKVRPDQVELIRRDYFANGGWETFLSYEDPEQDILIGLLRLRKCSELSFRPELKERSSIVRELHVYGSVVPLHNRDPTKFQHKGFGTLLMEEAERIACEEHGSTKLAVISGVGTRHYYRKLGYELDGPFVSKDLVWEEPLD
eukprot:gb/GECH01014342.1/.p1 GENE.gb/GECH01014342.1/~~gb/GECH01014342.1/.p1  ORF type:complete len:988 (+),score=185.26 gb/GECH01014342.1/:1-2964(+)